MNFTSLLQFSISGYDKTLNKKIFFDKFLKFLAIGENKDKLLKVLQYLIKLILISGTVRSNQHASSNDNDLRSFVSTISIARKLARLGNWLSGMKDISSLNFVNRNVNNNNNIDCIESNLRLVSTLSSIGNDLLDDWICLQKTKLITKRPYLKILDLWSTRLWFISVSIEILFTLKKLKLQYNNIGANKSENYAKIRKDLILTASKQFCDWTFCLWELADWSLINEYTPILAGISSAIIGAIRGWRKLE